MEITHRTRNLRIAPRKLRLVADQVKYKKADQALAVLSLVPNKGGMLIHKSLRAAIEAAKDKNLDPNTLVIQRVFTDEGTALKRVVGGSKGRMSRIMKKYSHLSLVLTGEEQTRSRRKVAKPADSVEEPVEKAEEVTEKPVSTKSKATK